MAWMPVDQFLPTHRKTIDLAKRMSWSSRYTAGVLLEVWGWAIDHCPDGYIDAGAVPGDSQTVSRGTDEPGRDVGTSSRDHRASLAKAVRMSREELASLLLALRSAGWIDLAGPTRGRLHEWDEWGGKIVARREYERNKKREKRQKQAATHSMSTGTDPASPEGQREVQRLLKRLDARADVPRDNGSLSLTKTRQDEIRQEPPSPSTLAHAQDHEGRAEELVGAATGTWRTVLELLRERAREDDHLMAFVTWYERTRLEQRGETYYVVAPNAFAREHLESRLIGDVRAALGVLVGEIGPDVRVLLEEQVPAVEGVAVGEGSVLPGRGGGAEPHLVAKKTPLTSPEASG
jgi:hypothetical protein